MVSSPQRGLMAFSTSPVTSFFFLIVDSWIVSIRKTLAVLIVQLLHFRHEELLTPGEGWRYV